MPAQINSILTNLPSGYHRDLQIIKEDFFNGFSELKACLEMTTLMLENIIVKDNILEDEKYKLLFTVESVNELVNQGMPFRDAYIKIGKEVEAGNYQKPTSLQHTHEGSIGNLCNEAIEKMMQQTIAQFPFKKIKDTLENLVK